MAEFVIPPVDVVGLPVSGSSGQFPVAQIYCVGRNYADHAIEMGHNPDREAPFFFLKSGYALLSGGGALRYPSMTQDLHHEVELVVALASGGENITVHEAQDLIYGFAVGIDLTRRDLQAQAKKLGRPWDAGKTFLHAAPCSKLKPYSSMKTIEKAEISLKVNGEIRQSGNLDQMIWKVSEIIARLSECFPLRGGDLIFTGTPAGVGPVQTGDELHAEIEGIGSLRVSVQQ